MSVGQCPECQSALANSQDETVCEGCGLVVESEKIDHGPEWRAFNNDQKQKKSRTGSGVTSLMHDRGLGSEIGWEDTPKNSRLRKWNRRHKRTHTERTTQEGIGEIRRMGSALDVPRDAQEVACQLFRQITNEGEMVGQCIETIAEACLYAGCRVTNSVRSFQEISHVSRVDRIKQTKRRYHDIIKRKDIPVGVPMPRDYLGRISTDVGAADDTELRALEILKKSPDVWKSGKKPTVVAGAALYIAGLETGEEFIQEEIGDAADVTPVAVRYRYQDMIEFIDTDIINED